MNNIIEIREVNGKQVKICWDDCSESPREWCNLGKILYNSSRYVLGDESMDTSDIEAIAADESNVSLTVYAYIHSGVALSLNPFGCHWDSGQSGIIYASKEKIRKKYNCKLVTKKILNRVYDNFKSEIETFSQYLNGEVYGIITDNDSIFGIYHNQIDEYINELKL